MTQLVELTRVFHKASANPLGKHLPLIITIENIVQIVPHNVYVQWTSGQNHISFSARLL